MLRASGSPRVRHLLRATAATSAALAFGSLGGTAYAAAPGRFGSPSHARSHGKFGAPASGAVYNGTQAVTQLTAVAAATRAASAGGALVTGSEFSGNVASHVTVTVDGSTAAQVQITGPAALTMISTTTQVYVRLDPTVPDVAAALQLLHATGKHYVAQASTDPLVSPADIIEQLYAADAPPIASMQRTEHGGLVRYSVSVNVPASDRGEFPDTASIVTDRSGRLISFNAATNRTLDGEQYTVRYGPQSVSIPNPQDVVDATQFGQAVVSAHLPQALAFVAEAGFASGYPGSGSETVAQFRAAVRNVAADPNNGMAGIATTVADVTNGVTLTARNPFTNANVTVRAVLDGSGWVSVTDSAGRPVDPDGFGVVTSLQLRRPAAVRLGFRH